MSAQGPTHPGGSETREVSSGLLRSSPAGPPFRGLSAAVPHVRIRERRLAPAAPAFHAMDAWRLAELADPRLKAVAAFAGCRRGPPATKRASRSRARQE